MEPSPAEDVVYAARMLGISIDVAEKLASHLPSRKAGTEGSVPSAQSSNTYDPSQPTEDEVYGRRTVERERERHSKRRSRSPTSEYDRRSRERGGKSRSKSPLSSHYDDRYSRRTGKSRSKSPSGHSMRSDSRGSSSRSQSHSRSSESSGRSKGISPVSKIAGKITEAGKLDDKEAQRQLERTLRRIQMLENQQIMQDEQLQTMENKLLKRKYDVDKTKSSKSPRIEADSSKFSTANMHQTSQHFAMGSTSALTHPPSTSHIMQQQITQPNIHYNTQASNQSHTGVQGNYDSNIAQQYYGQGAGYRPDQGQQAVGYGTGQYSQSSYKTPPWQTQTQAPGVQYPSTVTYPGPQTATGGPDWQQTQSTLPYPSTISPMLQQTSQINTGGHLPSTTPVNQPVTVQDQVSTQFSTSPSEAAPIPLNTQGAVMSSEEEKSTLKSSSPSKRDDSEASGEPERKRKTPGKTRVKPLKYPTILPPMPKIGSAGMLCPYCHGFGHSPYEKCPQMKTHDKKGDSTKDHEEPKRPVIETYKGPCKCLQGPCPGKSNPCQKCGEKGHCPKACQKSDEEDLFLYGKDDDDVVEISASSRSKGTSKSKSKSVEKSRVVQQDKDKQNALKAGLGLVTSLASAKSAQSSAQQLKLIQLLQNRVKTQQMSKSAAQGTTEVRKKVLAKPQQTVTKPEQRVIRTVVPQKRVAKPAQMAKKPKQIPNVVDLKRVPVIPQVRQAWIIGDKMVHQAVLHACTKPDGDSLGLGRCNISLSWHVHDSARLSTFEKLLVKMLSTAPMGAPDFLIVHLGIADFHVTPTKAMFTLVTKVCESIQKLVPSTTAIWSDMLVKPLRKSNFKASKDENGRIIQINRWASSQFIKAKGKALHHIKFNPEVFNLHEFDNMGKAVRLNTTGLDTFLDDIRGALTYFTGGGICSDYWGDERNQHAFISLPGEPKTSAAGQDKPMQQSAGKISQTATKPGPSAVTNPKQSSQVLPKQSSQMGPKESNQMGPKQSTQAGSKQSTEAGSKQSSHKDPKQSSQKDPKQSSQKDPKQSSQDPKQSSQQDPKQSSQDPKQSSQQDPKQSSQKDPKQSSQDPKQSSQQDPKQSSQKDPKQSSQDPKQSSQQDSKQPSQKDPKQSSQKDPKHSNQKDPKQSSETDPKPSSKEDPKQSSQVDLEESSQKGPEQSSQKDPKQSDQEGSSQDKAKDSTAGSISRCLRCCSEKHTIVDCPVEMGHRTWVIGDNYVRRASDDNPVLSGCGEVTWLGLEESGISELSNRLKRHLSEKSSPPDTLIIHTAANDIFQMTGREVCSQVEDTIKEVRQLLPQCRIIWSGILPRLFWYGEMKPHAGERIRKEINARAFRVCKALEGDNRVICHPDITSLDHSYYNRDGINLSSKGNSVFCRDLQEGIKYFNANSSSDVKLVGYPPRDKTKETVANLKPGRKKRVKRR